MDDESTQEIDVEAMRDSLAEARPTTPTLEAPLASARAARAEPTNASTRAEEKPVTTDRSRERARRIDLSTPAAPILAPPVLTRTSHDSVTRIDLYADDSEVSTAPELDSDPLSLDLDAEGAEVELLPDSSQAPHSWMPDEAPPFDEAPFDEHERPTASDVVGPDEVEGDTRNVRDFVTSRKPTAHGYDVARALRAMTDERPLGEPTPFEARQLPHGSGRATEIDATERAPWGEPARDLEDEETTQTRLPEGAARPALERDLDHRSPDDEALPAFSLDEDSSRLDGLDLDTARRGPSDGEGAVLTPGSLPRYTLVSDFEVPEEFSSSEIPERTARADAGAASFEHEESEESFDEEPATFTGASPAGFDDVDLDEGENPSALAQTTFFEEPTAWASLRVTAPDVSAHVRAAAMIARDVPDEDVTASAHVDKVFDRGGPQEHRRRDRKDASEIPAARSTETTRARSAAPPEAARTRSAAPPPEAVRARGGTDAAVARSRPAGDDAFATPQRRSASAEIVSSSEVAVKGAGEIDQDRANREPISSPARSSRRPAARSKALSRPPSRDAPTSSDSEERALLDEHRYGELLALYHQRLSSAETASARASILVKIAHVHEVGLENPNEAFETLVEAFELTPDQPSVVSAIDRVGRRAQRIGELADKVKKKLLPGSPDDRRVVLLGHLVFWYERVLGRGREISPFVSEIEQHDKVHPIVLKRAAKIAEMNGDTKTQREHLERALDRTYRDEEKVVLHLALANAYAGTGEAIKHYEAALRHDPTSLVALQGIKRLGSDKEQYDRVRWALERLAEVAPTEAERIDAFLELAELHETKFLERETAAELLERVLVIDPAHPVALKGLERCYHALREWAKLSRILQTRSQYTYDTGVKIELLELAIEVHESKLGDPAGAVEVCLALLDVAPKHRRALGDLARLYEKLGDWPNVARYKAELVELSTSKRVAAMELVKLGDHLDTPERDSTVAKQLYERAVDVDPTNAAAWEALQRFAADTGDEQGVIECLEQRAKHTDVPRQRAAVFVELAMAQRSLGDLEGARVTFERAIQTDSSNEVAAVAMLDAYTAEERWAEAAPLCELLVNAAIRDRDGEALFLRLRLSTRIAAALGDADRAMMSAVAALDARPKDPDAQADLIAIASQLRDAPSSLARAKEHLARIAESPDELSSELLVRLAALLRDGGNLFGTSSILERALTLDPDNHAIAKELVELYVTQGDFPRACKHKVDLARKAGDAETKFTLLCEAGEIWARRAEELQKAASVFEEARAIKPLEPSLLQTMSWLYGELGEWKSLVDVLESVVRVHDDPVEKAKNLATMADIVRDRLEDRERAVTLFEQALDANPKRLDVFEELVRMLTETKSWERLERAYQKMLASVGGGGDDTQLRFLLLHQLGLIYRDRLGDASRAYDALDEAARLRPDDAEVRKIVVELLVVTDNLDNAVERLRNAIDRTPHEPQLYAELYELFLRQHSFDKAWCTVNVLGRLRELTPEQRRFHEDYAPFPLEKIPGQLVEQAWRSHIFHADLDPALTGVFAAITPAVARMRHGKLRVDQRVTRPFTSQHSRLYDLVRTTFDDASEILAVPSPELLLGDLMTVAPFSPALDPFGALLVCGPAAEAQEASLVYLVGKRLAERRLELAARALFPSVSDLTSLLNAAIRVGRKEPSETAGSLDQSLAAALTKEESAMLRNAILRIPKGSPTFDVKRWLQLADLSSTRAGLLITGDVEPARAAILSEETTLVDLTPYEKVGELYKFATSDLYADLRGAIGVAVQA